MAGTIERNSSNLHDDTTGLLVGYKNPLTGKEEPLAANALQALVSDAGILGTLVCDWQTGGTLSVSGSTGAASAIDSSVTVAGRPSLRVTMGATGTITIQFTFTSAITFAQLKTMQFPIRVSRNANADGSLAVFANPNLWIVGTSGSQWRYNQLIGGWRDSAWRTWSCPPGGATQGWSFGGSPLPTDSSSMDADTIASIRIVYTVNAQDAGETIWLGPITSGARRKGRVSVVMDGCYNSQNQYILPMMRAQGLRASLAVVNGLVGQSGSFDWTTLGRHYSDGHNVLHHTFDNTRTNGYVNATDWPTAASITADVAAGFADLTARGYTRGVGYGVWGYVLPWAAATGKTRQDLVTNAIRAGGMRAMRNGTPSGGSYTRLQSIAHPDYVDPMSVQGAIQITSTNSAQDVKDVVDRARDRGEWGIITVHRSVVSTPGSLEMTNANFDDWISYLGAQVRIGGVDCTPFDEVCSALGVSAI